MPAHNRSTKKARGAKGSSDHDARVLNGFTKTGLLRCGRVSGRLGGLSLIHLHVGVTSVGVDYFRLGYPGIELFTKQGVFLVRYQALGQVCS